MPRGPRPNDDRIEEAKRHLDVIDGFRGSGPEERGVVACAEALVSIAEDVRAIRAAVVGASSREVGG